MCVLKLFSMTIVGMLLFLETLIFPLLIIIILLPPSLANLNIMYLNLLEIPIRLVLIRLLLNLFIPQILSFHPFLIIHWVKRIVLSWGILRWWGLLWGWLRGRLLVVLTLTTADYVHYRSYFQPRECVQLIGHRYLELLFYLPLKLLYRPTVIHLVLLLLPHFIILIIVPTLLTFFHIFSPPTWTFTELFTRHLLHLWIKRLFHPAVQQWHALRYQWIVLLEK